MMQQDARVKKKLTTESKLPTKKTNISDLLDEWLFLSPSADTTLSDIEDLLSELLDNDTHHTGYGR